MTLTEYLGPQSNKNSKVVADVLEPILINYSCDDSQLLGMSMVDDEKCGTLSNFSQGASTRTTEELGSAINFSIMMYLKERKMSPREALRKRIQFLVNYMKTKSKEDLMENREYLLDYIKNFLLNNIVTYMKGISPKDDEDESKSSANLMIALGISQYVTNKKLIMNLQRELRRLAVQLSKDGYMRIDLQKKVSAAYTPLFTHIIKTIEKKFIPEEKWGILIPEVKNDGD